jgi:outer membrane receptor protein involved in Fe transport
VIVVKGTQKAVTSDFNGNFELETDGKFPLTFIFSLVGYETQEVTVKSLGKPLAVKLPAKQVELKDVDVVGSRIAEKQKEAPLTVESIDRIAIKECAQTSFYEALGTLKGVDMTSASLGFTIINTRGFNSTSPVRSLQIIDGVDNQSPGLNFSLGNFLGCSELDVLKVDLIAGASSAYYGPNAFNGVISITSRSPFIKPGLEVSAKAGERNLLETAVRWSQVIKNKNKEDKFGYKLCFYSMKANDWVAENMDPTIQSLSGLNNPGSYDAVNRYGDEYLSTADFSTSPVTYPGLGTWYRTGYLEKDIVDYNTENIKASATFHYKIKNDIEAIFATNYGSGTTVYQGDNRYSLKDIEFFQNRIEVRKPEKFFVRFYYTREDAGKSYDAFFTALKLQQMTKTDNRWAQDYYVFWATRFSNSLRNLPGFPQLNQYPNYTAYANAINPWLAQNYPELLQLYHDSARDWADNHISIAGQLERFEPGTERFDSAFNAVTSTLFTDGGSRFYDRSALLHFQMEYKFDTPLGELTLGCNHRVYYPDSRGTIFSDTGNAFIRNNESGAYGGLEKKVLKEKLKLNLTGRVDRNQNYNNLYSGAFSAVYTFNSRHLVRLSYSTAIRNPTLSDQYLFYRVTPLVLLVGNLNGFDSLVTLPSLMAAFNTQNQDTLQYFNVKPIEPEKVKTVEAGYRASLLSNLYLDVVAYYSWYNSFIGYKIGASVEYVPAIALFDVHNVFRVAANAVDQVTTRGFSAGLNYYFLKFFMLNGNYSYNLLDRMGSTDPLIPAYNTPENKYNIGISGRDIDVSLFRKIRLRNFGFSVNYKWIQGFSFEGSPQFTGFVPPYSLLDAQLNYNLRKIRTTFKAGASNLLDNRRFTVYGGPYSGRILYFSLLFELHDEK